MSDSGGATLPELERIALHVHAALRAAMLARYFATPGAAEPEEAVQAAQRAGLAVEEAAHALALLDSLGARPADVPLPPPPIPLHLLDTPDARELLGALRHAVTIAERVDRARGRALPPSVGLLPEGTRGLDLAETLSEIARRLEMEIYGPADVRQDANRAGGPR